MLYFYGVYMCVRVSLRMYFSHFFFIFVCFCSIWLFFLPVFFSNERGKEGMELDGWGGREHLAGDEGLILTIRIYCIKN